MSKTQVRTKRLTSSAAPRGSSDLAAHVRLRPFANPAGHRSWPAAGGPEAAEPRVAHRFADVRVVQSSTPRVPAMVGIQRQYHNTKPGRPPEQQYPLTLEQLKYAVLHAETPNMAPWQITNENALQGLQQTMASGKLKVNNPLLQDMIDQQKATFRLLPMTFEQRGQGLFLNVGMLSLPRVGDDLERHKQASLRDTNPSTPKDTSTTGLGGFGFNQIRKFQGLPPYIPPGQASLMTGNIGAGMSLVLKNRHTQHTISVSYQPAIKFANQGNHLFSIGYKITFPSRTR